MSGGRAVSTALMIAVILFFALIAGMTWYFVLREEELPTITVRTMEGIEVEAGCTSALTFYIGDATADYLKSIRINAKLRGEVLYRLRFTADESGIFTVMPEGQTYFVADGPIETQALYSSGMTRRIDVYTHEWNYIDSVNVTFTDKNWEVELRNRKVSAYEYPWDVRKEFRSPLFVFQIPAIAHPPILREDFEEETIRSLEAKGWTFLQGMFAIENGTLNHWGGVKGSILYPASLRDYRLTFISYRRTPQAVITCGHVKDVNNYASFQYSVALDKAGYSRGVVRRVIENVPTVLATILVAPYVDDLNRWQSWEIVKLGSKIMWKIDGTVIWAGEMEVPPGGIGFSSEFLLENETDWSHRTQFDQIEVASAGAILVPPEFEKIQVIGNEWFVTWNYEIKTENVIGDPLREMYVTREQAEKMLADAFFQLTNTSPMTFTFDAEILVLHT